MQKIFRIILDKKSNGCDFTNQISKKLEIHLTDLPIGEYCRNKSIKFTFKDIDNTDLVGLFIGNQVKKIIIILKLVNKDTLILSTLNHELLHATIYLHSTILDTDDDIEESFVKFYGDLSAYIFALLNKKYNFKIPSLI